MSAVALTALMTYSRANCFAPLRERSLQLCPHAGLDARGRALRGHARCEHLALIAETRRQIPEHVERGDALLLYVPAHDVGARARHALRETIEPDVPVVA